MATVGNLVVKLLSDTRGFSKGMKKAQRETKAFSKAAKVAGAAVATFFSARFASSVIQATNQQIKAERKLAQVLKSTGNAAGFTAQQLQKFARERQAMTGIGDEFIIDAAGMMATFTQISGPVFLDAIRSAQDLSAAFGQDLKSSVISLGKALNDPVLGITALSRVGVTFSQTQKDMIRGFMRTNDLAKAQRVILDELKVEMGDAAVAMKTGVDELNSSWSDLKETMGFLIEPAFSRAVANLSKGVGGQKGARQAGENIGQNLGGLTQTASDAFRGLKRFGLNVLANIPGFGKAVDAEFRLRQFDKGTARRQLDAGGNRLNEFLKAQKKEQAAAKAKSTRPRDPGPAVARKPGPEPGTLFAPHTKFFEDAPFAARFGQIQQLISAQKKPETFQRRLSGAFNVDRAGGARAAFRSFSQAAFGGSQKNKQNEIAKNTKDTFRAIQRLINRPPNLGFDGPNIFEVHIMP